MDNLVAGIAGIWLSCIFILGVLAGYSLRTFPKYDRRRLGQPDRRNGLRRQRDIDAANNRAKYGLSGA